MVLSTSVFPPLRVCNEHFPLALSHVSPSLYLSLDSFFFLCISRSVVDVSRIRLFFKVDFLLQCNIHIEKCISLKDTIHEFL